MRRLAMVLMMFAAWPLVGAERKAFVWASNPTASEYTADANYSWSSSGGAITIARDGAGSYSVTFAGLGSPKGGGNVQVTPYGGREPRTCTVMNWSGAPDLVVRVRCHALGTSAPADSNFSMLVTWPPEPMKVRPVTTITQPSAAAGAVQKTVTPEGRVVKRYPDGHTETLFSGGRTITFPDGREQTLLYSTGAPAAIPPTAPDDAEQRWLSWHNDRLIAAIRSLVGNNQLSVDNYVRSEGDGLSVYQRIAKRGETINLLLGE